MPTNDLLDDEIIATMLLEQHVSSGNGALVLNLICFLNGICHPSQNDDSKRHHP